MVGRCTTSADSMTRRRRHVPTMSVHGSTTASERSSTSHSGTQAVLWFQPPPPRWPQLPCTSRPTAFATAANAGSASLAALRGRTARRTIAGSRWVTSRAIGSTIHGCEGLALAHGWQAPPPPHTAHHSTAQHIASQHSTAHTTHTTTTTSPRTHTTTTTTTTTITHHHHHTPPQSSVWTGLDDNQ